MLDRVDETIVAISSAPGTGPVGIVRLSGPKSLSIADDFVRTTNHQPLHKLPGSTRTFGHVALDGAAYLPADCYVFRAPHSYTRQDMVEIHAPGSPATLELIRRLCLDRGARPAQAGEFTARAFLSGAMDLTRAEAVAGVIRAESDTQLRASRRMMEGDLSLAIQDARDRLAEMLALVEADIDFSEEPIDFITPDELRTRLEQVSRQVTRRLTGGISVERFDALPRVLLFGPPNAGKSALMNRLSGTSRAICAAVAGTTRDILAAPIALGATTDPSSVSGAGEAILLDTAGVDTSKDEIIAQARALTLSAARRVDLICVVVDLSVPHDDHLRDVLGSLEHSPFLPSGTPLSSPLAKGGKRGVERCTNRETALAPLHVVVAANKRDLVSEAEAVRSISALRSWQLGTVCEVSAATGQGVETLRNAFGEALGDQTVTTHSESLIISERQRSAVMAAREAITRAAALAENAGETIDCADLVAFELREALDLLGEVTGAVTTTDLLSQVFAKFCIGK